jgi:tetratricopeptide (TPR) repeat protein
MALILAAGLSTLLGGEAHRRTEKGNAEYLKKQNDAAMLEYQKAQAVIPEAAQLHYDIGNVLYRQENWAGAAQAYQSALAAAGPDLSQRAAYNLGNALFHDEKYDEAVKAYTRALKGAPADADAKHNLEMALRALEQQKQQQQKQQQKQDDKQNKDDKKQPSGGKPDDKKQPAEKQPEGDDKNPGDKKQQQKPGGMTKDEAAKLLDRLNDQEKENVKRAMAQQPKDEKRPEKDW